MIVVPSVKLAYDWPTYVLLRRDLYRFDAELKSGEDVPVSFVERPAAFQCHPMEQPGIRDPDGIPGYVAV